MRTSFIERYSIRNLIFMLMAVLFVATASSANGAPLARNSGFSDTSFVATGEGPEDSFGSCVANAGDLNGDGYNDIVVGAYLWDAPYWLNTGRAYVYFTGASADSTADIVLTGGGEDHWFGGDVSSAGDMNGDGLDDLIIGASGFDSWRGRAFLFWGGPTLLGNISAANADVKFNGEPSLFPGMSNQFGYTIESIGDLNRDGRDDVLISAPGYDGSVADLGRAYIIFGDSTWSGQIPATDADIILTGVAGSGFGLRASCGDFNGDAVQDFAVGAYRDSTAGGPESGRVFLFLGDSTFTGELQAADADLIVTASTVGMKLGRGVSLRGDINGDDFADLVISSSEDESTSLPGQVFVFYGGSSFSSELESDDADLTLVAETVEMLSGRGIGDWNSDGYDELQISSPLHDAAGDDAGRLYLFFGGTGLVGTRSVATADIIADGAPERRYFGGGAWIPQMEAGRSGALAISASTHAADTTCAGRVYVFPSPGTTPAPVVRVAPPSFRLHQNWPNPVRGQTTISFELPTTARTRLVIWDVAGREVRVLENSSRGPGIHRLLWNGLNKDGSPVGAGVYFYSLEAAGFQQTRKLVVVR